MRTTKMHSATINTQPHLKKFVLKFYKSESQSLNLSPEMGISQALATLSAPDNSWPDSECGLAKLKISFDQHLLNIDQVNNTSVNIILEQLFDQHQSTWVFAQGMCGIPAAQARKNFLTHYGIRRAA